MSRGLVLAFACFTLLAVALAAASPRGLAQTSVAGVISGPKSLAPLAVGLYHLNASGGPAEGGAGNYSVSYYLTGADGTGLPVPGAPRTASNTNGTFTLNVTAPQSEGQINLVVVLNSSVVRGPFEKTTLTYPITVVAAIVLTATFANDGAAAAVNVPVTFYVDGALVGRTNISRIEPGATGTATLSFLPVGLAAGRHTVRVEADLNKNGVIEPDKGEVVVVDVFYKQGWQLTWPWAALIIAIAVSVTSMAILRVRSRPRR